MKKYALMMALVLGLTSCGSQNKLYDEQKRLELTREANAVVTAVYQKWFKVEKIQQLDVLESRKGFSDKVEKGVVFKTKDVLKGSFTKKQFAVGVEIPKIAFGISPDEFSGQKKYTLYLVWDPKLEKDRLIGAEWETPKY